MERAGVPFVTVSGRGFLGRPEIRDLLNALRTLADPSDDLALAGLLRSPAFGVTDGALHTLVRARREAGADRSLWSALEQAEGLMESADRAGAARARAIVLELHELAGRAAVGDLLKAFLDRADYRAILRRSGQQRALRNVGKLLLDAMASGIVGVGEFIEYVGSLRDAGSREGEARSLAEDAVQVMSVHAAKGLEFPIVVVGHVTSSPSSRNDVILDTELGPVLPVKDDEGRMPGAYTLGKLTDSDKANAESDRLLYVAATRSRELLLLSGYIGRSKDGRPSRVDGWLGRLSGTLGLADLDLSDHDPGGDGSLTTVLDAGGQPIGCTVFEPGHQFARTDERGPSLERQCDPLPVGSRAEPDAVAQATPSLPRTITRRRRSRSWRRSTRACFGSTVTHVRPIGIHLAACGGSCRGAQADRSGLGRRQDRARGVGGVAVPRRPFRRLVRVSRPSARPGDRQSARGRY